jgi:hypothetical protein
LFESGSPRRFTAVEFLHCPQLEILTVNTLAASTLLDFLKTNTGGNLHTLSVGQQVFGCIVRPTLAEVLTVVPTLKHLIMVHLPPAHFVIPKLTDMTVLPHLEELMVFRTNKRHSQDLIEQIVESRWRNGALKSLVIDGTLTPKLQQLRDEGLNVFITTIEKGKQLRWWPCI